MSRFLLRLTAHEHRSGVRAFKTDYRWWVYIKTESGALHGVDWLDCPADASDELVRSAFRAWLRGQQPADIERARP